eukprot:scaffold237497_cov58-Attheya_sp.AAC.9
MSTSYLLYNRKSFVATILLLLVTPLLLVSSFSTLCVATSRGVRSLTGRNDIKSAVFRIHPTTSYHQDGYACHSNPVPHVRNGNCVLWNGDADDDNFGDADDNDNDDSTTTSNLGESDQVLLGVAGTLASVITLYSESVLKSTGCGLPAGPFGLVGAAEGVSYLGVVGVAAYSLYTKIKTGRGLPAGPGGILGAAEGLSFLAIFAGLVVLGLQITNYGYIPNAIPGEGAICK